MATKEGQTSIVQILLQSGHVDVNAQEYVSCPFHVAACLQIRTLNVKHYEYHTFDPQSAGWSALFYAAQEGHLKITEMLIEAGADVFLKDKVMLIVYMYVVFTGSSFVAFEITCYIII